MKEKRTSRRPHPGYLAALGLGVVGIIGGIVSGSERLWPGYLVAALFVLTIALGAASFVAIHHLTNSAWSSAIRRVPEAMMRYLFPGAIALLVVLFGAGSLFEWTHDGAIPHAESFAFKSSWLSISFFAIRMIVILGSWCLLAFLMLRASHRQDREGGLFHTFRLRFYSGIFVVLLALTLTVASVDWVMSLDPEFYSTLFGWYIFSGLFASGLAAVAVAVVLLRKQGKLREVTDEHVHTLGKMVFAFSTFWAYLWFCQFMLIYYTNMPEESMYFAQRMATPGWSVMFWGSVVAGWVVPFVVLIGRGAKRNQHWLMLGSLSVLLGHWADLYVLIFGAFPTSPFPGLIDTAILIGFIAVFILVARKGFRQGNAMPIHDPYLVESLGREYRPEHGS